MQPDRLRVAAVMLSRRAAISGLSSAGLALAAPRAALAREADGLPATQFAFRQVDVFSPQAFRSNPLAVVIGADALSDEQMRLFSKWTNLSETTSS